MAACNTGHCFNTGVSRVLWSRPIPLGWYFDGQWERKYGKKWPEALCDRWMMYDRYLKNFASEIPVCPCTQEHALTDKGRFLPDPACDKDINPECYYHKGALHCVRSGAPRYVPKRAKLLVFFFLEYV